MSGIFIYADKPALSGELITLAKELGSSISVLCLNAAEADQIAQMGADKVYILDGESDWAENYARAMADLLAAEAAELFLVGATVRGRDIAAKVAAYQKCGLVGDVSTVKQTDGGIETTRMMYGGAVVQTNFLQGFNVVTVPAGKCECAATGSGSAEIITREVKTESQVELLETVKIEKQGVDLCQAKRVVCIGLGVDDQNALKMVEELNEALDGAIACTRPIAEEKGWLPADLYIGISGKSISPDLYVGLGISGQVQHTVGIRDSKIIVAVNNNDKAPIFRIADYGIVGDMNEVVPLLTKAIKNA